jgi:tetratricopeptide (TPR) repeat protein
MSQVPARQASTIEEARRLQQTGRIEEAEKLLDAAELSDIDARHREILLCAMALARERDPGNAARMERLLLTDAAADPPNSAYASDLSLALYLAGRFDLALHMARVATSMPEPDGAAFARLGVSLLGANRPEEAAEAFKEAVLRDPEKPEAHTNLGRLLVSLERPEEALEHFEHALRLKPDMNAAHRGRAGILLSQERAGELIDRLEAELEEEPSAAKRRRLARILALDDRYRQAEGQLRQAVSDEPEDTGARLELAEILERQDRHPAVLRTLKEVLDKEPENLRALLMNARALTELGVHDKAAEAVEQALEAGGEKPGPLMARASLAAAREDYDAAESDLRKALSVHPGSPAVLSQLGHTLMWTGRIDEAVECFEKAARISPQALAALVTARKFPEDEATIERMRRFAADPLVPSEGRSGMHFALASTFDKLAEYGRAFEHLDAANTLVRKGIDYDPDRFSRQIEATMKVFREPLFRRTTGMGIGDQRPLFVVGMPRSGTTLTETVLGSHSAVFPGGEMPFLPMVTKRMPRVLKMKKPYPICMGRFHLRTARHAGVFYVKNAMGLEGARDKEYRRIVDKLPHNFQHLGLISIILPGARIVHVRRDPRDTAVSNYFQNFKAKRGGMGYAFDLTHIGRQIADYLRIMDYWRERPEVEFMDMRYEDLVHDPETSSRAMLDHAGLDFDPKVLEHHKTERAVRTASVWQVRQPIYKTSAERWRRYEPWLGPLFQTLDEYAPGWEERF